MLENPEQIQTLTQRTAVIRFKIPRSQIVEVMAPGIEELTAIVRGQGIAITGPWFSHHFRMDPEFFDFELGVPVAGRVRAEARVQSSSLPAARVARTIYRGGYEGLGAAWSEFNAWIEAQGFRTTPDLWERYLSGPESGNDPRRWMTELNRPLLD